MFRDLLCMHFTDTSFNDWTRLVRHWPVLARRLGFESSTPAVATRYAFCYRLLDGPPDGRPRLSAQLQHRRFPRLLAAEKAERNADTAGLSDTLSERLHRRLSTQLNDAPPETFLGRVMALLGEVALRPSAQRGLFEVARDALVDGSLFWSQASGRGHAPPPPPPLPDPETQEKQEDLSLERYYADPTATWGYSASKDEYIFGHRLHVTLVVANQRLLPLSLSVGPAHVSDIELGLSEQALRIQYLRLADLPLPLDGIIADKGYDSRGVHRFLRCCGYRPLIPLRDQPHRDQANIARNEDGVPLCPAGLAMRYHGYHRAEEKHTYNCPVKRPGREKGKIVFRHRVEECPHGQLCEPDTKMGPLVHLRPEDDPRLNPEIPRNSADFKERFAKRGSVESFFNYVKGPAQKRRYRREHLLLLHALSKAIRLHTMAWQDG